MKIVASSETLNATTVIRRRIDSCKQYSLDEVIFNTGEMYDILNSPDRVKGSTVPIEAYEAVLMRLIGVVERMGHSAVSLSFTEALALVGDDGEVADHRIGASFSQPHQDEASLNLRQIA